MAAKNFSDDPKLRQLDTSIKAFSDYNQKRLETLSKEYREEELKPVLHTRKEAANKEQEECLRLMEEVFAWRDWFVKTDTFIRLSKLPYTIEAIYKGDWGHYGPWERPIIRNGDLRPYREALILMNSKGDLAYLYVSSHGSGTFELPNPGAAAGILMIDYVRIVHDHIMSGRVYEFIKQSVDNNLESVMETDKMCDNGQMRPDLLPLLTPKEDSVSVKGRKAKSKLTSPASSEPAHPCHTIPRAAGQ